MAVDGATLSVNDIDNQRSIMGWCRNNGLRWMMIARLYQKAAARLHQRRRPVVFGGRMMGVTSAFDNFSTTTFNYNFVI